MKILFVGTGLIGGSFSLALQKQGYVTQAGGYSRNPKNLDRSVELGIIQEKFDSLQAGVAWADWIILSIPVDAIVSLLPGILDMLVPGQLVIDFGSTKGSICQAVRNHPKRDQFLAAHPIAGTEYSGPDAAFASLFEEKLMIICERQLTELVLVEAFEKVCLALKMKLEQMDAEAHDRHLAYISHLCHITSFALSNAVLEKEKEGDIILDLAGSGFASTVRLAKSSPDMWGPIFMENRKMILESLEKYQIQLEAFRILLEKEDQAGIRAFLENGNRIRKIIP